MKTFSFLLLRLLSGIVLPAQEQSPIPKISLQITNYFSVYPRENIFLMTDKVLYKPGETIWFRAFTSKTDNPLVSGESGKLYLSLFDKTGKNITKGTFRMSNGSGLGDLKIPDKLDGDIYFLIAYSSEQSSLEQVPLLKLKIDPQYSNQWVVESSAKDSISISGKKNELHVVLSDNSGAAQKNEQLRYEIKNGSEIFENDKVKTDENGKVTIPFTIPAKTNGEPFICELSDSKGDWKHEIFLPSNLDPIVIRFYPEGGNLINRVATKVGYTAFNKWGIPVVVEGSVMNQDGELVTPIKTLTKGLGLFSIVNPEQKKYKLMITGEVGQNQSFEIPVASANGLALSVVKTDAEFIYANLTFSDQQKHAIALTVTHGNNVYWAGDMEIDGMGRLKIPADELPQGINLLSVFSKEGNLLAERIVFRDNKQQLKINVQPEKSSLTAGGKMNIKIRLTDENNQPVSGNIAVSVTDKFRNDSEKPQIEEYLQIESELESPFSLFPEAFNNKSINPTLMDVFLIANRIKGFDWAKIRQFKPENASYTNTANFRISGFVTDKNGSKVNKAKVSLVNNKNMQLHTTTTNSEGIFSFPNLYMSNIDDFSAKASDPDGKHDLKVNMIKNLEGQISVYIADNMKKFNLINSENVTNKFYFDNNEDLFSKAPKVYKVNTQSLDNQRKLLNSATSILDVIKTIKPYKIVNNQIVFFGSENSLNYQGGALIVLDGQQLGTDIGTIQGFSPSDIDHINVSTNPLDIQKYTGLNSVGVIEIFQKKAKITEPDALKATNEKFDGEFRVSNVFSDEPVNPKRNIRTTLLWLPDQNVDQTGLFEFELTSGKVISDFVIEVQGMTSDGRMGNGKAIFSVIK